MHSVDKVIGVGEASPEFLVVGYCDILASGITTGAIKLQYKLPPSTELPAPAWTDFPDGSYTADFYKTVFLSEHGVIMRLLGVANNAGVYVRIARYLNK